VPFKHYLEILGLPCPSPTANVISIFLYTQFTKIHYYLGNNKVEETLSNLRRQFQREYLKVKKVLKVEQVPMKFTSFGINLQMDDLDIPNK
jgi:hypothetical protein